MLGNYLIIAWRNLWNNKLFSIINILGLSIGMTVFMLIMLYVNYELSYDKFWSDSENIYRVGWEQFYNGESTLKVARCYTGITPAAQAELPEVLNATIFRVYDTSPSYIQYIDHEDEMHQFSTRHIYTSDSHFFEIFDIPFLRGDPVKIMGTPNSLIINHTIATKLFGNRWQSSASGSSSDPLGKRITLIGDWGSMDSQISGVMEDLPSNSHLNCEIVFNWDGFNQSWVQYWTGGNEYLTYLKVKKNINIQELQHKLEELKIPHKENFIMMGNRVEFPLLAVENIHLQGNLANEIKPGGNITLINVLKGIAFLILLLAWVNYINLSTARFLEWTKEVGLRKIAGASRKQLIFQFLLNTAMLTFASTILTITSLQLLIPIFNALINLDLNMAFFIGGQSNEIVFYLVLMILASGSILGAGIFPAILLSSFDLKTCLHARSMTIRRFGTVNLRKVLVFGQMAITLILLTGTITMYLQTEFMISSPAGFDKDQIIVLENTLEEDSTYQATFETFKNELRMTSNFSNVSSSSTIPGNHNWTWHYQRVGTENKSKYTVISVDPVFFNCYNLEFISGRGFITDNVADQQSAIINEIALKQFGFKNPYDALGQKIRDDLDEKNVKTVIGVIKDYHQSGFQNTFEPIIFLPEGATFFYPHYSGEVRTSNYKQQDNSYISINIPFAQENISPIMAVEAISAAWKKCLPYRPFNYFFLSEQFDGQYKTEMLFRKLFIHFTSIAIFIACTGLFGMSYYSNQQRTKEIGIRKSLGATMSGLMLLLSKGMMQLIAIAFIITLPISYVILNRWLHGYAFRIDITPWLFILPAVVVFLIALATVGYQTIKTALANPVKALRYE